MTPPEIAVVGAVIVRDGLILCARRAGTGPMAGLWEFPGGKVEPDESPVEALVREIDEELGCSIAVGEEVTTTTYAYDFATITLTTYWSELIAGDPDPTEHAEIRWLSPADLHTLEWAPADIPAIEIIQRG
ncbi:MAG: (deoxy)nucleoside triphosphate pyrophosphohydrolase [Intrasporangiaceae bacterium]|nr:(deoxy)nucleoside triphosphate pyrophosphohydrolase [Intrasporangiaceae bacterium]